jgi:nicotinamide riboside kinase
VNLEHQVKLARQVKRLKAENSRLRAMLAHAEETSVVIAAHYQNRINRAFELLHEVKP